MRAPATSGYSGTPLASKLGYKPFSHAVLIGAPADYFVMVQPLPEEVVFQSTATQRTDLVHVFVAEREELAKQLSTLRKSLKPEASVWVSWPKRAARIPTNVTEDVIREEALPLGFVDIKVCAVSELWSGLKLVVRKELR